MNSLDLKYDPNIAKSAEAITIKEQTFNKKNKQIQLKRLNIICGKNNAGKSSFLRYIANYFFINPIENIIKKKNLKKKSEYPEKISKTLDSNDLSIRLKSMLRSKYSFYELPRKPSITFFGLRAVREDKDQLDFSKLVLSGEGSTKEATHSLCRVYRTKNSLNLVNNNSLPEGYLSNTDIIDFIIGRENDEILSNASELLSKILSEKYEISLNKQSELEFLPSRNKDGDLTSDDNVSTLIILFLLTLLCHAGIYYFELKIIIYFLSVVGFILGIFLFIHIVELIQSMKKRFKIKEPKFISKLKSFYNKFAKKNNNIIDEIKRLPSHSLNNLILKDYKNERSAKYASDGTVQIFNVCYLLSYIEFLNQSLDQKTNPLVVTLHEPEAHLHPSAQSTLINVIVDIILKDENKNIFVLIETHSEHFIKGLESRILSEENSEIKNKLADNSKLFFCKISDKIKNQTYTEIEEVSFSPDKKIPFEKWPEGFLTPQYIQEFIEKEKLLKEKNEQELRLKDLEIKAKQDMLSSIAHTMRNSLSNGPETIRNSIRLTQKAYGEYYEDEFIYKAINKIAGLYSTFIIIDNLLDTYKLYVRNEEKVQEEWIRQEGGSDLGINYLFAVIFRQILSSVLFSENDITYREKLLVGNQLSLEKLRTLFINEVLCFDITVENSTKILSWVKDNLPSFDLVISVYPDIKLPLSGIRFNLLFSCISELIYNSVKYNDGKNLIQIKWRMIGDFVEFECLNYFSNETTLYSGSKTGLDFIKRLTGFIKEISFENHIRENTFKVILRIPMSLLK
jgi:predicted ATPase